MRNASTRTANHAMNPLAAMRQAARITISFYLTGLVFMLIGAAVQALGRLSRGRENILKPAATELFYASLNFLVIAVVIFIVIMAALAICTLIDVIRKYLK